MSDPRKLKTPAKSSLVRGGYNLYAWFEKRTGLVESALQSAEHPVPENTSSWWYVFGSAATVLLMLQVVTGILLALVYAPSASNAWNVLQVLNHQVALGWLLRAVHGWGSNFMIAIVLIHMAQVFLFGAYKFPRELTWMVGVVLLLLTLGMAFTGQVLRFDQDAYWGLGIGASIASRVPIIGGPLVHMILGGPIIGGPTLTRFFALHVFVIPGLLIALVGLHVWMVLKLGINDWPMPGRIVRKATYEREYHELTERTGIAFVPDAAWKDAVFAAIILASVLLVAVIFGPIGPSGMPDPTIIQTAPKPDFAFLWIYAVLAFLPPSVETPVMLIVPVLAILGMLALPLFAGEGEKHWSRRPIAVLMVVVIALALGIFTRLGTYTPWSPIMDAWTSDPVPQAYLVHRTPLERQGALVFQNKQCRNCHSLDGMGGQRGPSLDTIATRMSEDQLIRQVLQGGGNMPAFGNSLSPAETTALTRFLRTLRGPGEQSPADVPAMQLGQDGESLPAERHGDPSLDAKPVR
ncbi:cytochrome b N-terminal domain-containing protein [Granulicella tundricola]|uniref:Cytochrome b/b6 domain protein n=1 Tax=Granulicella tundricola (strain ATCC BAA-1859 / DSM 23138 / MP5ACTX9) TaxID=1198114 RepID=E8X2H8_GRATM|nr:cytochrome b N-terminal domain-containing protein [Granulicella tundricola]ADW69202.1 Cytochrome b/b6 domain protein [Granulicella tundricola MP5ACTX9]